MYEPHASGSNSAAADRATRPVFRLALRVIAIAALAFLGGAPIALAQDGGTETPLGAELSSIGDGALGLEGIFQSPDSPKWLDNFCVSSQQCIVGDFNGDGRDDIASLYRNQLPDSGDVWVALSSGIGFGTPQKWHDSFCTGSQDCAVGDFNGDGRDDLIAFSKSAAPNDGDVNVALSSGTSFGASTLWNPFFCLGSEVCRVGDFNGDNLDDIATFKRSIYGGQSVGDVEVALSNGFSFAYVGKWAEDICYNQEICAVGDINGDGRDDVVNFLQGGTPIVFVGLSTGVSFQPRAQWLGFFCLDGEICATGDFNGDKRADVIAFLRNVYPDKPGDVGVALSSGSQFTAPSKWHDSFCLGNETCGVGDFDADGRTDIISFYKDAGIGENRGDVYVALAGGNPQGFISQPTKWHDLFCSGNEDCFTGDFNGDGRDDVGYFVRDTQGTGIFQGDVYIALSNSKQFGFSSKWADFFCIGSQVCRVADVNGDGRDDLVSFSRSISGLEGDVHVALSTGSGFAPTAKWNDFFCVGSEVCEVGDFNGDGRDDIALFKRSLYGEPSNGDVEVALSTGTNFSYVGKWADSICYNQETCDTGDVNGDGRDDIINFLRGGDADIYVGLSTGSGFSNRVKWNDFFCLDNEVCDVGDFDGDGKADVVAFLRSLYGNKIGDVVVALSNGFSYIAQPKWSDFFCVGLEQCRVGDFNGDNRDDVAAFLRSTQGDQRASDVYVALASLGQYYFTTQKTTVWVPFFAR